MIPSKPLVYVLDDRNDLAQYFSTQDDVIDWQRFETFEAFKTAIQSKAPDMIIADIAKFHIPDQWPKLVAQRPVIWASQFKTLDFEQLPQIGRILNKPFRGSDLLYAVRAEFAKAKKKFESI